MPGRVSVTNTFYFSDSCAPTMQRGIVNLPGQSGTIRNARNGEISRENGEIYRLPGRAGTRRQAVGFDQAAARGNFASAAETADFCPQSRRPLVVAPGRSTPGPGRLGPRRSGAHQCSPPLPLGGKAAGNSVGPRAPGAGPGQVLLDPSRTCRRLALPGLPGSPQAAPRERPGSDARLEQSD
jgi:hypothetical protein